MRRKKKKEGNSERWLLTYSDLITLLMILFILLYSMSNISSVKYEQLTKSLSSVFGSNSGGGGSILQGGGSILDNARQMYDEKAQTEEDTSDNTRDNATEKDKIAPTAVPKQTEEEAQQTKIKDIKYKIDGIISKYDLGDDVENIIKEDGLVISFSNSLFFNSGETALKENMKVGLNHIAIEMNKIDNPIQIKGYTDNVPVKNSSYSSNWQLSAIRAANVVQYLIEEGKVDSARLTAVGCGENNPIASNSTAAGRRRNRRIEIVILYTFDNLK